MVSGAASVVPCTPAVCGPSPVAATVLTVYVLNGSGLVTEGPIATATVTPTGKSTFVPLTGHIEKFFSIEEWYPEVPSSMTGYDLRVSQMQVDLPATGLATCGFDFMGVDVVDATTQRFTTPTALGTSGIAAAVNGVMLFAGWLLEATIATWRDWRADAIRG